MWARAGTSLKSSGSCSLEGRDGKGLRADKGLIRHLVGAGKGEKGVKRSKADGSKHAEPPSCSPGPRVLLPPTSCTYRPYLLPHMDILAYTGAGRKRLDFM